MSVRLQVHVRPAAKREGLKGWRADGSLGLEVTAAPERGRANRAVERLLAGVLGIAPGRVAVTRGEGVRSKRVEVEGLSEDEVRSRIDAMLRGREDDGGE